MFYSYAVWEVVAVMKKTIAIMLAGVLLSSCYQSPAMQNSASVMKFESNIMTSYRYLQPEHYARYYAYTNYSGDDDLPFTSIDRTFGLVSGQQIIVSIWIDPDFGEAEPGIYIVDVGDLPYAAHGGCFVVNMVVNMDSTINNHWCNAASPH